MKALLIFCFCLSQFARVRGQDTAYTPVCLPLRYLSLTSPFGFRIHPVTGQYAFHAGIDLRARHDTVYAVLSGSIDAGYNSFLGIYVTISNGDLQIIYGHLSQVFVIKGDVVTPGMPVAVSGATGRVTGEHLHFAVRYGRQYIDPLLFLSALMNRSRSP